MTTETQITFEISPNEVYEIIEYFDSYLADLENNLGERPTEANIVDLLGDFGTIPQPIRAAVDAIEEATLSQLTALGAIDRYLKVAARNWAKNWHTKMNFSVFCEWES